MLNKNLTTICDDDIDHNQSGNEPFQAVLQARLGRRSILRGAIGHAKGLATVDRKVTDKIINNDPS